MAKGSRRSRSRSHKRRNRSRSRDDGKYSKSKDDYKRKEVKKRSPSANSSEEEKSSDLHSSSESSSLDNEKQADIEVTDGYRLYQERRKLRHLEESKKAAALMEGTDGGLKLRKVELKDFPNYKRKLVVQNIPLEVSEEEIMNYFYTVLSSISKEQYAKNPIMSVIRYKDLGFVSMEFRKREEAEQCLNLDGTEYRSGFKMRIMRVKRFMDDWNSSIEKGKNPIQSMAYQKSGSHFTGGDNSFQEPEKPDTKKDKKDKKEQEIDNRIYMGNIPLNMTDAEVKKMCESFGRLKSFNLVKDPANPELNKGYSFFEYVDERSVDKCIKALNGLDFKEKKLKVQKASTHQKPTQAQQQQIGMFKNVPDDKRMPIPLFAMTPSRVVQFINMISVEDLYDEEEIIQVKDDLLQECKNYGEIISIEIPRPDEKGNATFGVGKIFVKFNHIVAAKQARYRLSGRKYNGRTLVVSFYPEHYFDIKEFSII